MATPPDQTRLVAALEATWPPAETREAGGFVHRRGAGGGKRVSAASPVGPDWTADGIAIAEAQAREWEQDPLFRIAAGDERLDEELAARGYAVADPTHFFVGEATTLAGDEPIQVAHARGFIPVLMEEIWAAGGIGPGRLAVMERAGGPSVRLLGRTGDRPSGCAFVAVDGDVAMIHAIEVREAQRRKGVARQLMQAGARFARAEGADWLALAVTRANAAGNSLYRGLGMTEGGGYHYRILKETT